MPVLGAARIGDAPIVSELMAHELHEPVFRGFRNVGERDRRAPRIPSGVAIRDDHLSAGKHILWPGERVKESGAAFERLEDQVAVPTGLGAPIVNCVGSRSTDHRVFQ